MTAFFELKPNRILSHYYTLYPSYSFSIENDLITSNGGHLTCSAVSLYENSPYTIKRYFYDAYQNQLSASGDFSGSIFFTASYFGNNTNLYFSSCLRLKNLYASSSFYKPENYATSSYTYANITIVNIPSILYGAGIKPGSFSITNPLLPRYSIFDDGLGGLYVTSSITSLTLVGSIMYQHGICLFADALNFSGEDQNFGGGTISFSGTHRVPQNIYLVDVPKGEANFSTNPSYVAYDTGSHQNRLAIQYPKTYITAVGLYSEDYELLGVIKLATPLYHDEGTPAQIRAKLNF